MSTLSTAERYINYNERTHRKTLMSLFKRYKINIDPSKTAWCAAFITLIERMNGRPGTGKLNARSYLKYGTKVSKPIPGDIVIFSRGNSAWQGHVAYYVKSHGGYYTCLGGNQGDKVCYRNYPKHRLLGFRRV